MKRILIVGATSLIAEHCARLWVNQPSQLVLAGRDLAKLERVAQDLRVRSPGSEVACRTPSFDDPVAIGEFIRTVFSGQVIDIALVAHGSLPAQDVCQRELVRVHDALLLNAVSPALYAEALAGRMQAAGQGSLAVIGSVAGDRGRRSNYVYGAAKGLLASYAQGLQHRLAGTGVRVTLVKPGPTATPMTAGMGRRGIRLADPALVARDIVAGIAAGRRVVYTPGIWRLIMLAIVHIPHRIFDRMSL